MNKYFIELISDDNHTFEMIVYDTTKENAVKKVLDKINDLGWSFYNYKLKEKNGL